MNVFKFKSYLITLAVCLLFCVSIKGQLNNRVELLSTEDGLSQGMIYDILQDSEGFIWIATKDGLNRYDGNKFKVFTNDLNDPWSISGNQIENLFEDSKGRIWASTSNNGVNIYDKHTGKFHHLKHDSSTPAGITGNNISAIVEDTSGYFIVVVDHKELNMFRLEEQFFSENIEPEVIQVLKPEEEITSYDLKHSEDYKILKINGIVKDAKDRIWVGGVRTIYQLKIERAELVEALKGYKLLDAVLDTKGSLWIGLKNDSKIIKWDGEKLTEFQTRLPDRSLSTSVLEIMGDSMLIGSYGAGIFSLNIRQAMDEIVKNETKIKSPIFHWKLEVSKKSIEYEIKDAKIDKSGIIWFGTNGYGVYKINLSTNSFGKGMEGVSVKRIYHKDDNIYLLNNRDLLKNIDNSPVTDWNLPIPWWIDGIGGELLPSHSGSYWFRGRGHTEAGNRIYYGDRTKEQFFYIRKYSQASNEFDEYYYSWQHTDTQPFIESKDGSIWMSGYNHVLSNIEVPSGKYTSYNSISGKIVNTPFDEERGYAADISTALYEDNNNTLWVGSESGISRIINPNTDNEQLQVKLYKSIPGDKSSLSYNHVTCFLDDPIKPDKYLWICTKGGGLNRLDKETNTFISFTTKEGLPNNVIYGILADGEGNIWGSTNNGLFCMSQKTDNQNNSEVIYSFRNFHKAEGLQDNEFNTGAYAKLPDGKLAFGGINGYNIFDPQKVLTEEYVPSVYITKLIINNQTIKPGDETGIAPQTIENTNSITLSHLDNILTLEYASLDYGFPERNRYRYQLVGADTIWVEAGNNTSATFINLKPNQYIFRVQGSNSQGIWSDQIAELEINVLPPWWKTWWAYLSYALLSVFCVVVYFKYSMNRSKLQQQLEYEKRETERVKDLDTIKNQLYMNLTHEFRTPLTIILGMTKLVQDNPKEHFTSGLNMITRNGQDLLNLINKMLNLSKLESGKMSLDLVHGDIVFFLRNLVESFHSYAANKEIRLHFLPEVDAVQMDFDADKLQQVVSNLISNAFKFTPEGGHIYFNVRQEQSSLVIRVKDTGQGISKDALEKVFDRFYQADTSTTRLYEGSGIGLALSKELVLLMQGEISVISPPVGLRKGTEFKLSLPIENQAKTIEVEKIKIKKPEIEIQKLENVEVNADNTKIEIKDINKNDAANPIGQEEKPLILLVEDNKDVAAYIVSCLFDDYKMAVAENGQEGLELARELIPDLVISDVMMPIMDGFEFCKRLKSNKLIEHIPVIILTARADMDSKLEGLEIGANAYLPKPFEKQELLFTLKNMFKLREKLRLHYQNLGGLTEFEEEEPSSEEIKPEEEFVINIRGFIEMHIDNFDLNVELLAKEMHLSHSQLGRKLDALTGFSPNRFIRFLRLKKAKELLRNPKLSITAVAYDSGFSDPSYFTRVFKKEFGFSPVEWRTQDAKRPS